MFCTRDAEEEEGHAGDEVDGGVIPGVDKTPALRHRVPPLPGGVEQGLHQLPALRFVITNHL